MFLLFAALTAHAEVPAARCAALVDRLAADQQAALVLMGAKATDASKASLRSAFGARAEAACAKMDPTKVACVEASKNSIAGVADCGLNAGKGNGERLDIPYIGFNVPFLGSSAPGGSAAELEAAKAELVGDWTDGQGAWERGWVFAPDGKATQRSANNGKPELKEGTYTLVSPQVVKVTQGGSNTNWSFDIAGGWLVMGTSNEVLLPPVTKDAAQISISGNIFLVSGLSGKSPTCTLIDGNGRPAERCAVTVSKEGADTKLAFVGKYGHRLDTGEEIKSELSYSFVLHGGRPFLASPTGHLTKR